MGHLDIIERASHLCDELIVAVLSSGTKDLTLDLEQRERLIELALSQQDLPAKIRVVSYEGLTAKLCQDLGVQALVRGLRNNQDYNYEIPIAEINRQLLPGLETVFLQARPELAHVSASLIREMYRLGEDYRRWLAPGTFDLLDSYLKKAQNQSKIG